MQQEIDLTREFVFDAAHRITNHPGKCASLHGHTWRARVTVRGPVNPETGMVMDFYDLRRIGAALFDDLWDHAALLFDQDPLVPACRAIKSRLVVLPAQPTSENLAAVVAGHFTLCLPRGVARLVRVEIAETPNCCAAVHLEWS